MANGPSLSSRRRTWLTIGAVVAAAVVAGIVAAGPLDYLQQDARISGKELHSFTDPNSGEHVTVVLGDFKLALENRTLSGRDAVVWIHTFDTGGVTRHDLTIYIEGQARIVEPGGAVTTDNVLLADLHLQGRIIANGKLIEQELHDYPLLTRAIEQRQAVARKKLEEAARPPSQPPPLITLPSPPPEGATGQPPGETAPPEEGAPTPTPAQGPQAQAPQLPSPPGPKPAAKAKPPAPKAPLPVSFYADKLTSEKQEPRRVTIARGNVYLSQGNPKSEFFLELRSDAAVVFSERRAIPKGVRGALAADAMGQTTAATQDANAVRENITGVYLLGDVVISQGEKTLRAPEAYYDFVAGRAIIRDPVFRMREPVRNVPLYVRAKEGRLLSAREMWFQDSKVSTSDFYTPSYSVNSDTLYVMDNTPYDEKGQRLGEQSFHSEMTNMTWDIEGIPFFYLPYDEADFTAGNTPIRKIEFGREGDLGNGLFTEWYLFRLLGLVAPEGVHATLDFDVMKRGYLVGIDDHYSRPTFSGYDQAYFVRDNKAQDTLGQDVINQPAPNDRGRLLMRHKQDLGDDWQVWGELSYLTDRNFLQEYFTNEFYSGKEQETVLYAKKQRDNWAFTALLQDRLNRFQAQPESLPDLGFVLNGEPMVDDLLSVFSDDHLGAKKFDGAAGDSNELSSSWMLRGDTRDEVDMPLHLGPINVVPFATGRLTGWSDSPPGGDTFRPFGEIGVKANTHFWRVYDNVESRLWDLHGLKHIITPEAVGYVGSTGGVEPQNLFPLEPDGDEDTLMRESGMAYAVYQRLQTKRGEGADEHVVDWMRFDVTAGFFNTPNSHLYPASGEFFMSRPEDSIPRDFINGDYAWHISDATTFLADTNWDVDSHSFRRSDAGIAVQRDPRLAYYLGVRSIQDLDSTVGTAGASYQINRKYTLTVFEQYDFQFNNGENLDTSVSLIRKLDRWYAAFTFTFDARLHTFGLYVSLWPEGAPEIRMGNSAMNFLGPSSMN